MQGSRQPAPRDTKGAARRLFAASRPLPGSLAETYRVRVASPHRCAFLPCAFTPRCYYRADDKAPPEAGRP